MALGYVIQKLSNPRLAELKDDGEILIIIIFFDKYCKHDEILII